MGTYSVIFIALLVSIVSSRPLAFLPGIEDGSFDPPFSGEIAIDVFYIKTDSGSTTATIAGDEFTWQASQTLGGEERMGLVTFFDGLGDRKLTYEGVASRCVPSPSFGQLDPATFGWNYVWGKDAGTGSFISAKMIVLNRENGFFATFVYLSENGPSSNTWHEEDIDSTTNQWTIANVFWFGALGDITDDATSSINFINDNGDIGTLNTGMMELFATFATPPALPSFTGWGDTNGRPRSLDQWFNPTTDISPDYLSGSPTVNPFYYALTNDDSSFPEVFLIQFGIGTSAGVKRAWLDETTLTLGGRVVQQSDFDTMGPSPSSTAEEIDRCRGTCTIPRMAKREYNNIKGFRNQKLSMEGKHNDILNLVSDDHCQVNAKLGKTDDSKSTRVTLLGFSVGDEKILVGCDDKHASVVQLNGKPLASKQKFSSSSGFISLNEDGTVTVAFPLYQFKLSIVQVGTPSCHVGFNIKHWHGDHDSPPHGLLGLTVHDIGTSIQSKMDALLKDNLHDFRVSDMFSSDFKHNRYNATLSSASDLKMNQYFAKRSVFISETI